MLAQKAKHRKSINKVDHDGEVLSVAYQPDESIRIMKATGSGDKKVRVIIENTNDAAATWTTTVVHSHAQAVKTVAFCPGESVLLASGSRDGKVLLSKGTLDDAGDPEKWTWERVFSTQHVHSVNAVAFHPDGTKLAIAAGVTVAIWERVADTDDWSHAHDLKIHDKAVCAVHFSPTGGMMATGGEDGIAAICATTGAPADWKRFATLKVCQGSVLTVAFSPTGTSLATGGADKRVCVWETSTSPSWNHVEEFVLGSHVNCVVWSPLGTRLVAASNCLDIWDTATWRKLEEKFYIGKGRGGGLTTRIVHSAAMSPCGQRIASGDSQKKAKSFDATGLEAYCVLQGVIEQAEQTDQPGLAEALEELSSMIGLRKVKNTVATIVNGHLREPATAQSHRGIRCYGPPGVGKSTVAKIIARILTLCELVSLENGGETFVKMRASDLIAGYEGQTEDRARKYLDEHGPGAVLFFDEANSFTGPFAAIAASAINVFLDDYQGRTLMVVAGYPAGADSKVNLDDTFFSADRGLIRRFPTLQFEEYDVRDLVKIFKIKVKAFTAGRTGKSWRLACSDVALRHLFEKNEFIFRCDDYANGGGVETLAAKARDYRLLDHTRERGELDLVDIEDGFAELRGDEVNSRAGEPTPRGKQPTVPYDVMPSEKTRGSGPEPKKLDSSAPLPGTTTEKAQPSTAHAAASEAQAKTKMALLTERVANLGKSLRTESAAHKAALDALATSKQELATSKEELAKTKATLTAERTAHLRKTGTAQRRMWKLLRLAMLGFLAVAVLVVLTIFVPPVGIWGWGAVGVSPIGAWLIDQITNRAIGAVKRAAVDKIKKIVLGMIKKKLIDSMGPWLLSGLAVAIAVVIKTFIDSPLIQLCAWICLGCAAVGITAVHTIGDLAITDIEGTLLIVNNVAAEPDRGAARVIVNHEGTQTDEAVPTAAPCRHLPWSITALSVGVISVFILIFGSLAR
eukprot:m.106405 g.106405  ORF g.106405 m.106405 type:complete len:969 (+) comp21088_c0_seq1:393-3299(+)